MLEYDYPLFRPPAEANNIIIQVTYGCSYNNCSFCSMYKTKSYEVRDFKSLQNDIDALATLYPDASKVFLADGDALSIKTEYLIKILQYLQIKFPKLKRVSLYGSTQNIVSKSKEEFAQLVENRLTLIYYGVETGSEIVLKKITKGVSQKEIITSLNLASLAGMKISATVILGIGGKIHSNEHIEQTAIVINKTTVNYLSTLQLGLEEEVKENFYTHFKDFEPLDDRELLQEQKYFLELLNPINRIIFRSNHASNALHLAGNLPRDSKRLIGEIITALQKGENSFVPQFLRGF